MATAADASVSRSIEREARMVFLIAPSVRETAPASRNEGVLQAKASRPGASTEEYRQGHPAIAVTNQAKQGSDR